MNGQVLGQKYVVKDISKENPQIVFVGHDKEFDFNKLSYSFNSIDKV